jgi:hypothetical protein
MNQPDDICSIISVSFGGIVLQDFIELFQGERLPMFIFDVFRCAYARTRPEGSMSTVSRDTNLEGISREFFQARKPRGPAA